MAFDFASLKTRYDELIRSGKGHIVRQELIRIRPADVERAFAADLANIGRRIGLPDFSLRVLQPIVHPQFPLADPATPREIAIYASALSRIGALDEALALLQPLRTGKSTTAPEVLLYLSFAYIHQWNYASAITPLKAYIDHPGITSYESLIGKLNLAGAYQFTGQQEPQHELLEEIIPATIENNWHTLRKNALELAAQAALSRGDWSKAETLLAEAERVATTNVQSDFLVRKWRAVTELRSQGPSFAAVSGVDTIRSEALRMRDFETMRECDFYLALSTRDNELLNFVYFGTPHKHYKRRVLRETDEWHEISDTFEWRVNGQNSQKIFDLKKGQSQDGVSVLKTGQSLHRLLLALSSDFYRPLQVGTLFARLYPDEFFDPVHSPARLRRLIERLRGWFAENDWPLSVRMQGGTYQLISHGPCSLLLHKDKTIDTSEDRHAAWLATLKSRWPYQGFTSKEAARQLQIPEHHARTMLKWAVSKRKAYFSGRARALRFRLAK